MNWEQYLNLEYQVNTRLVEFVNYIRANNLMPNSAIQWDDVLVNVRSALTVERSALSEPEELLELARQLHRRREEQEYKARLARERGRGTFGATHTGD